ncbi:hypothetical protein F7725_017544 [Dissostichus mawsoni]|uniref:Uncharacterized protein n=1 Tax=Dissostichus mawsoni TaxID=36200 RepID=A0A7J5Z6M0_DISMA|nr:hypothetical protein F7725_017544 [Dissostichus mawsoni]
MRVGNIYTITSPVMQLRSKQEQQIAPSCDYGKQQAGRQHHLHHKRLLSSLPFAEEDRASEL